MSDQDWKTIIFSNTAKTSNKLKPKLTRHTVSNLEKLDNSNDVTEMKKKSTEKYGKKIQQLRMAKGFTQKTFANFLNLSESVIKDYEADRIQPEGHIRSIIMRKCNCKL